MKSEDRVLSLAGRYTIQNQLAVGKNGVFFAAQDQSSKVPCVVKIYKSSKEVTFYHEIEEELAMVRRLKQLGSPSFVKILDLIEEKGRWFAVFERIEGISLLDLVSHHPSFLKNEEIKGYFRTLLDHIVEMEAANGTFSILQLSPENIIVTSETVRMVDFELQYLYGNYAKPLLLQNKQFLTEDEIISQLGRILYLLTTKKMPEGPLSEWRDPQGTNPAISDLLLETLRRCMNPRRSYRFVSLGSLCEVFSPKTKKSSGFPAARRLKPLPILLLFLLAGIVFYLAKTHQHAAVRFSFDKKLLCVATDDGIQWLDPEDGKPVESLPIPGSFSTLLQWQQTGQLILADSNTKTVFVVDPARPENASLLLSDIVLSADAFDPTLHLFFASNEEDHQIFVTTQEAGESTTTIALPYAPNQMVLDVSTHKLYVSSGNSHEAHVVDILGNRIVHALSFQESPNLVYADSKYLYVYFEQAQNFAVFSPSGKRITSIPHAFNLPIHIASLGGENLMIVWSHDPRVVFMPANNTPAFSQEFVLGFTPVLAAVDDKEGKMYAADSHGNLYSVPLAPFGKPMFLQKLNGLTALALWNPRQ